MPPCLLYNLFSQVREARLAPHRVTGLQSFLEPYRECMDSHGLMSLLPVALSTERLLAALNAQSSSAALAPLSDAHNIKAVLLPLASAEYDQSRFLASSAVWGCDEDFSSTFTMISFTLALRKQTASALVAWISHDHVSQASEAETFLCEGYQAKLESLHGLLNRADAFSPASGGVRERLQARISERHTPGQRGYGEVAKVAEILSPLVQNFGDGLAQSQAILAALVQCAEWRAFLFLKTAAQKLTALYDGAWKSWMGATQRSERSIRKIKRFMIKGRDKGIYSLSFTTAFL